MGQLPGHRCVVYDQICANLCVFAPVWSYPTSPLVAMGLIFSSVLAGLSTTMITAVTVNYHTFVPDIIVVPLVPNFIFVTYNIIYIQQLPEA